MDYVVALPSYNRPDGLRTKTMALLERHGIDKSKIHIFVADDAQAALYSTPLPGYKIIAGGRGLCTIRNYIAEYFDVGTHIFFMDDDVTELYQLQDTKLVPLTDLDTVIRQGFDTCVQHGRNMWGIYPVLNGFYMKHTVSTDCKFCIGHTYGIINQRRLLPQIDFKEDYARTLQHCVADGGVVRFNYIAGKTKLGAPGGIGTSVKDRVAQNTVTCQYFLDTYPAYVRLNTRRPGEILVKNPKKSNK